MILDEAFELLESCKKQGGWWWIRDGYSGRGVYVFNIQKQELFGVITSGEVNRSLDNYTKISSFLAREIVGLEEAPQPYTGQIWRQYFRSPLACKLGLSHDQYRAKMGAVVDYQKLRPEDIYHFLCMTEIEDIDYVPAEAFQVDFIWKLGYGEDGRFFKNPERYGDKIILFNIKNGKECTK